MTLPKRHNPLAFPRPVEPVYPKFHPLNRDTYDHGFDLIGEIAEHRWDYQAAQGDPWMSIHNFPTYLRSSVDRVRSRAQKPNEPKPSMASVVACCIDRGVKALAEYNDIIGLIKVKARFDAAENLPPLAEEFYSWWQLFRIGPPDSIRSGSTRINVALPLTIKQTLHDLADELGISDSSLAVLATMHIMSECPAAIRPKDLASAVSEFLLRVNVRRTLAEGWFSQFVDKAVAPDDDGS